VTGTSSSRVEVRWGKWSKIFDAEELANGVNLSAEFLDNPFSGPFKAVESAVSKQQQYEATGARSIGRSLADGWRGRDSSWDETTLETVRKLEAAARAAVKPVRHTLTITSAP
jgi:hypothetical protein